MRLKAEPISQLHNDAFDIARFDDMAEIIMDRAGAEMVVLHDGTYRIQLEITEGTLTQGPVRLHFHAAGFSTLDASLRTLSRLHSLQRLGRFSRTLFPFEHNAAKWARALQAWDGAAAGASHREIAIVIFGEKMVREEWNGRSDFLKSRTHRMLKFGKMMIEGGYRKLLA